jgi:hypothetical protein
MKGHAHVVNFQLLPHSVDEQVLRLFLDARDPRAYVDFIIPLAVLRRLGCPLESGSMGCRQSSGTGRTVE